MFVQGIAAGCLALAALPALDPALDPGLAAQLTADAEANYRQVVDYDLSARLTPADATVTAHGRLKWTNTSSAAVADLWWHLYLNAFSNDRSTFIRESGGKLRDAEMKRGEWGWIDVTSLSVSGYDLLRRRTFEHPDDDNTDDRTVMRTPLPQVVLPGQTIDIDMAFTSKLPPVFARAGHAGDFFMVAQWYPKLGVLQATSTSTQPVWNCHQYHAHSEYFADYGRYRVAITTPADMEVGATGRRVSRREEADGSVTVVHEQDRVHDFAWVADRRFTRLERTFDPTNEVSAAERAEVAALLGVPPAEIVLPRVQVTLLIQPEHTDYADRYLAATFAALKWFSLWYGPYPYDVLTVVDGPQTARGAMGMEYPTLFTGGVRWPSPPQTLSPELVTVHEFGHQFWYGLVGSNEFEESWLDEGFNTYSTGKVLDRVYGARVIAQPILRVPLTPWFDGARMTQVEWARVATLVRPNVDAVVRRAWQYRDTLSYGVNSYPRAALMLHQLERDLSEATVARAMRLYAQRFRYRHPTTEDFVATVEEVAGRPLGVYFDKAVRTAGHVDYAVAKLTSERPRKPSGRLDGSRIEAPDPDVREAYYETEVRIERRGEVTRPVVLEVEFEDGVVERRHWDGEYRYRAFSFRGDTRARFARIHPSGDVLVDLDDANDSKTIDADLRPGFTWAAHIAHIVQTVLQIVGMVL